jgi:hypothetical protein
VSCTQWRPALLEAALGGDEGDELRGHLQGCASCREALEAERALLARIDGEVAATLRAEPSAGMVARARARAAEPRRAAWRLLVPAAAVAAGLLAWWQRPARIAPSPLPPPVPTASLEPPAPLPPPATAAVRASVPPRQAPRRAARTEPALPEVLVPAEEQEALRLYLAELGRRGTRPAWPGSRPAAQRPPSADLAAMPTQAAVTAIDLLAAPRGIEMGAIRIAPIGVQLLTMEIESED